MRDAWQSEFYRRTGKRIRQWRGLRQMPQSKLAEAAGLSRPVMANIEAGRQRVTAHQLWRIAVVLDLPIGSLMPQPLKQLETTGSCDCWETLYVMEHTGKSA